MTDIVKLPVDPNLVVGLAQWIIALLIVTLVGLVLFGWLLFRSGQLPDPGPIVVSVSLLSAVALVGGIITSSSEVLTLAATGFGALAGSLAAIYRGEPKPPVKREPPDRPEGQDVPGGS